MGQTSLWMSQTLKPLSHLRTDAADRSRWSTDEISHKEYRDSTEFCLHQPKLAETVRREYGASTDAVTGGQTGQNFPQIAAYSDECSTVTVQTSRTEYREYRRPAAEATRRPRRDYRESTQRVRRLWRDYAWSTNSADTVRMCCSSTDTVRTSAMFGLIYSLPI